MGTRFTGLWLGGAMLALLSLFLGATSASAAPCANEALRFGASAQLPECRAYELVSPADKGDGYVLTYYGTKAGLDGNGIAYLSTAALANAGSSPLFVADLSTRDAAGWTSSGVDPSLLNPSFAIELATPAISDDLGKALAVSRLALTPGATEGGSNVYLRDNRTGAMTLIRTEASENLANVFGNLADYPYVGGTPNWSHLVLRSTPPLVDGVPENGVNNIYDYTGGHVEVVDRLPNGEIPSEGASAVSEAPGGISRHGVSADGSRIYFWVGNQRTGPLYMREDDSRTVPISVSQKEGPEKGEVMPVTFEAASADGEIAYFSSTPELTEGSHANDLYRYDLAEEKLTDLSPSSGVPLFFIGMSEDGSYAYFSSQAALTGDATEASGSETNVYLRHDGKLKLAFRLESEANSLQLSPNGEHLAFVSASPLTADDVPTQACPSSGVAEHCTQVFDYETLTGHIACASCAGPAQAGSGFGSLGEVYLGLGAHNSRDVLDNGSVIFETAASLVPRDSNGLEDVYLWHEGVISLISSGNSEQVSNFADASPDGSNIFFRTNQRLVGVDTDAATDVYDARVDGGLAAQNPPGTPPACNSEACRGPSPAAAPRPHTAVANAPVSACRRLGRSAARYAAAAKRLDKRAAKASGSRVKRLRAAAAKERNKARRSRSRANHCGRAGA